MLQQLKSRRQPPAHQPCAISLASASLLRQSGAFRFKKRRLCTIRHKAARGLRWARQAGVLIVLFGCLWGGSTLASEASGGAIAIRHVDQNRAGGTRVCPSVAQAIVCFVLDTKRILIRNLSIGDYCKSRICQKTDFIRRYCTHQIPGERACGARGNRCGRTNIGDIGWGVQYASRKPSVQRNMGELYGAPVSSFECWRNPGILYKKTAVWAASLRWRRDIWWRSTIYNAAGIDKNIWPQLGARCDYLSVANPGESARIDHEKNSRDGGYGTVVSLQKNADAYEKVAHDRYLISGALFIFGIVAIFTIGLLLVAYFWLRR